MTTSSHQSTEPEKKGSELVRFDANMEAPIWAPQAYASDPKRVYPMPWKGDDASVTVRAAGELGQLRAFDKKVLAALIDLWHHKGRSEEGRIYFQIIDVIKTLYGPRTSAGGKRYQQIKQSLERLRLVGLTFVQSFADPNTREFLVEHSMTVLEDLVVVEPKKKRRRRGSSGGDVLGGISYAVLNFSVVRDLLGNYTRPLSLRLLNQLSERGILFESYISAVLTSNASVPVVRKDVFTLWEERGLSTKGVKYASKLKAKMIADLDKMVADPDHPLGAYEFEKSKSQPRHLNLVLRRKRGYRVEPEPRPLLAEFARQTPDGGPAEDIERIVARIRMQLQDDGENDANYQAIAKRFPESEILAACYEAWERYRDRLVANPRGYFVEMMKRRARAQGRPLPFDRQLSLDLDSEPTSSDPGSTKEGRGEVPAASPLPDLSPEAEQEMRAQYEAFRQNMIRRCVQGLTPEFIQGLHASAEARTLSAGVDPASPEFRKRLRQAIQADISRRAGVPPFVEWLRQTMK